MAGGDIKTEGGLAYTVGGLDDGRLANIEQMGSEKPQVASTARLNRDIANVFDRWLENEGRMGVKPLDVLEASMYGAVTIIGTILINLPHKRRLKVLHLMRDRMIDIFDAMGKVIEERNTKD